MVARVNSGTNIQRILNYNENKVNAGVAECIHENLYGCEPHMLSFTNKLTGLKNFSERNQRATSKAVHITLSFHPDDKIDHAKFKDIADTYMERIGFANQPYLVYRHEDTAHPHIHIVSTNIKQNGERIVLYNIGRNQSEKARKEIEKEFGLIEAEGRKDSKGQRPERALYGKIAVKKAISNALQFAIRYRYTSLPEFNAVLRQFNVVADRGKEQSFLFSKKGLMYSLLDKEGRKIGVPIKASSFYNKPTLAFLEKQFKLNEALRLPNKERLMNCITQALNESKTTKSQFIKNLNKQKVFVLFRQNEDGVIYGITFVNNITKSVFNGSDLGKAYSAKALTERFAPDELNVSQPQFALESDTNLGIEKLVDDLVSSKQSSSDYLKPQLRRRKRKKRGRSI